MSSANGINDSSNKTKSLVEYNNIATYLICTAIFVILIVLIVVAVYKTIRKYYFIQVIGPEIHWSNEDTYCGRTVTCKVEFLHLSNLTSDEVDDIIRSTIIHVQKPDESIKISVITEDATKESVKAKFTVRKAGIYNVHVKYSWLFWEFSFLGSPFNKEFISGEVQPARTKLDVHNPNFICVQTSLMHTIKLDTKDQYGNICNCSDIDLNSFRFIIKDMQLLPDSTNEIPESGFLFSENEKHPSLLLKTPRDSIYTASLLYSGVPIHNGLEFTVISISSAEEEIVEKILLSHGGLFRSLFNWESTHFFGIVQAVGEEPKDVNKNPTYVRVTIVPRYISIEEDYGILYWGKASYAINKHTRLTFTESLLVQDEMKYCICVSDGLQSSMTLLMKPGDARILLHTFAVFQGDKLRYYSSFEEKKKNFQNQLCGISLFWRFAKRNLHLYRSHLVESMLEEVQNFSYTDWCAYFNVSFVEEASKFPVRKVTYNFEWLTLLCDEIFANSPTGMFCSLGSTNLIHPNLATKRNPKWERHHYQLAGKILGKCLYEASTVGKSFIHVRFTRSLLAKLVGLPINYTHLVQDNPEECYKIRAILSSPNVENLNLTFTVDVDSNSDKYEKVYRFLNWIGFPAASSDETNRINKTNLIPEGSNVKVTNENKIFYLNAMAQYELGYKFNTEITAIREGFYSIVSQELVSEMNEYDLDLLLCGGSRFSVKDLKVHHKLSVWSVSRERGNVILSWFWSSITNMNEEERARLLQLVTGSCILPAGGFKDLSPPFTIGIKESFGQKPIGIPSLHEISLSDHANFEEFEKDLLAVVHGEWRQI